MEASTLTTAAHSGLLGRRSPLLRLQGDERLVALIRDRHDRAFEVLFDRYQARLLAFCRHLLNSHQDAEDVLQEVFVAAHTAMLADERPIKARPWLYRIARNRCLNHLRRQVPDGQDSMDIHPHENGTTTLEHVQTREQLREIVSDMHHLPETQRTAMVLREIDDLAYTEIAQAMGTTLPAVKSLLVRARMALAEASEARLLTCDDVRLELAEAAEGLCKASGPSRRHVRDCSSCRRYRRQLRSSSKAVAGLAPFGLVSLFQKLIGAKLGGGAAGTASAGGGAAAAGGSSTAVGGALAVGGAAGGTLGAKAAVGMATAALFTAGAVGVNNIQSNNGQGGSSVPAAQSQPAPASHPLHRVAAPAQPTGDHLVAARGASPSPSAKASKTSAKQTGGTPTTTAEATPADGGQAAPETTDTGQAPPPVTGAGSSGSGSSASGSSSGGDTGEDPAPPPPPDPTPPPPPDPTPTPDPNPTPSPTPPPDQPPAPSPPAG